MKNLAIQIARVVVFVELLAFVLQKFSLTLWADVLTATILLGACLEAMGVFEWASKKPLKKGVALYRLLRVKLKRFQLKFKAPP